MFNYCVLIGIFNLKSDDFYGKPKEGMISRSTTVGNSEHATVTIGNSTTSTPTFGCACGKVFTSKEYLSRHQRYKLKMFKCPLCDKNFGQWYNLKSHLASKHVGEYQQESFECGRCGQVFPNIEHVVAHYQAVHMTMSAVQICHQGGGGIGGTSSVAIGL